MLDIFGSVFGKSKKSGSQLQAGGNGVASTGSPSTSRRNGSDPANNGSTSEADDFLMVGSSGSIPKDQNPIYPTILTDDMLRTPSNSAASTWNSHHQPFSHHRTPSTPLDNVPFSPTAATGRGGCANSHSGQPYDLGKCFQVVDRVGHFLSTPSQSDYNFSLENSVVRESQAQASFPY